MLKLYTKDRCFYCKNLKKRLDEWGFEYTEVNIEHDPQGMEYFQQKGYKTVPQLYYNCTNIQQGESTALTKALIEERIERVEWPHIDSGIE